MHDRSGASSCSTADTLLQGAFIGLFSGIGHRGPSARPPPAVAAVAARWQSDHYEFVPDEFSTPDGVIVSSVEDDPALLDAVLRTTAHDLRSALSGIVGLTSLIMRSDDLEQVHSWAARILDASDQMETRITEMAAIGDAH